MERLTDIVNADLRNILCDFRDFTRPVRLKVGNVVYSIYASLQSDKIALTADIEPINVYELSIYFEDITDEAFKRSFVKGGIVFISLETEGNDSWVGYRIVDTATTMGVLRSASLMRTNGR